VTPAKSSAGLAWRLTSRSSTAKASAAQGQPGADRVGAAANNSTAPEPWPLHRAAREGVATTAETPTRSAGSPNKRSSPDFGQPLRRRFWYLAPTENEHLELTFVFPSGPGHRGGGKKFFFFFFFHQNLELIKACQGMSSRAGIAAKPVYGAGLGLGSPPKLQNDVVSRRAPGRSGGWRSAKRATVGGC